MKGIILPLLLIILPLQLGRHFWLENSYIFGLKVDYLSPTLYVQDILILTLIIFWLVEKRLRFNLKNFLLVAGYFLLAAINILFSLAPLISFFAWLRISEFILLGLVISKNSHKVFDILGKILPAILIFEFGLGFVQTLRQSSVGGLFWFFGERTFNILTPGIARGVWQGKIFLRPYGTFSHPNSLAGFILVAIILVLSKKNLKLFDKLSVFCGFFLIFLSFSRTVWLALFIIGTGFVLQKIFLSFKIKKFSLDFLYFFSLFTVPLTVFLFSMTSIENSSFENRKRLADTALLIIRRNPLFGIGANNFIIGLSQENTVWQWSYWLQPVHNIFLLVASEVGLIGFVFFLTFLVVTIWRLFQHPISNTQYPILISLLVILFTGLFDHYWLTLIQNQLLFTVILGLACPVNTQSSTPSKFFLRTRKYDKISRVLKNNF